MRALQARCLEAVANHSVDATSCVVPVPGRIDAAIADSYLDRKYPTGATLTTPPTVHCAAGTCWCRCTTPDLTVRAARATVMAGPIVADQEEPEVESFAVPEITADDHVLGPADAPVAVLEQRRL